MALEWIDSDNRVSGEAVDFIGAGKLHPLIIGYEAKLDRDSSNWFVHTEEFMLGVRKFLTKGCLTERNATPDARLYWYTRIARALTACFVHPRALPTSRMLVFLCIHKDLLRTIFAASRYGGTQHLLAEAAASVAGERATLTTEKAVLLLAVMPIDDVPQPLMDLAFKLSPDAFFILLAGWLGQRVVFTAQGEANRSRLLAASPAIRAARIPNVSGDTTLIANAWMACVYACAPHKAQIRIGINAVLRRHMQRMGINPRVRVRARTQKKRPRMLVIHEHFISGHVQFRCYAPFLRSLSSYFRLQTLADKTAIDGQSNAIFEKVVKIDKNQPLPTTVRRIEELKPDVIYYPSIGMADWVVGLANLRLAPVQIASLGVPETTHSPDIDYALTFDVPRHLFRNYSEKVLIAPVAIENVLTYTQEELAEGESKLRKRDGRLHVAVNSASSKITAPFLDTLGRIGQAFRGQIQFHFFPYGPSIERDGVRALLERMVPECEVYDAMLYKDYMASLAQCDLALMAFPFGATNTVIDVALLELPMVVMAGDDLATDCGAEELRRMGHDTRFIADSDGDYYSKAVAIIRSIKAGQSVPLPSASSVLLTYSGCTLGEDAVRDANAAFLNRCLQQHELLAAGSERVIDAETLSRIDGMTESSSGASQVMGTP